MRVFLDFEASSLGKHSFPVEVAWVFEDGRSRSFLIRPLPEWSDWSDEAERLHGISKAKLDRDGMPPETVAQQMISELSGHALFASAPSWDGKWMSTLLRGGGFPRHALRLAKSDEAFFQVAREVLSAAVPDDTIVALVEDVIRKTVPDLAVHRALADAGLELERLKRVVQAAQAQVQAK
ncbi:MAG: hypothetical protein QM647_18385 [Asticcacaulis sp.]|uniref:3'-5' exonuclease n=1 Tax=Asticcacaulis sp. TaxID=1872648 RepID=UPI0039E67227